MPRELLTKSPHLKFDHVAISLYNIVQIVDTRYALTLIDVQHISGLSLWM